MYDQQLFRWFSNVENIPPKLVKTQCMGIDCAYYCIFFLFAGRIVAFFIHPTHGSLWRICACIANLRN